ncbi:hypothetical protein M1N86_01320 [Dehalococcoidia bacterium]|nr:hypothetical protein [Dehalococcoidia bacterium]MCL0087988.1 hypothetical protein [Dehalococcoidia bacterium]
MPIQQQLAEITSIEVPPEIQVGKVLPIRVQGTIGTPLEGHLSAGLLEPPAYNTFRSFTSTPILTFSPPGFDIVMELDVQMDNVLGVNQLRVDLVSGRQTIATGRVEILVKAPEVTPTPPDIMGPMMGIIGIALVAGLMARMMKPKE